MKPLFIKHRVNAVSELSQLGPGVGAEIDLRSDVSRREIHLAHDPYVRGTTLSEWLSIFSTLPEAGPLVLNTKEDGLEVEIIEAVSAVGVQNYFFLDTSIPTLVRLMLKGVRCFALRLSAYEPSNGISRFTGRVDWIWVDCFGAKPVPADALVKLRPNFKICLASPELQGGSVSDFPHFVELASLADAICTKNPAAWRTLLGGDE